MVEVVPNHPFKRNPSVTENRNDCNRSSRPLLSFLWDTPHPALRSLRGALGKNGGRLRPVARTRSRRCIGRTTGCVDPYWTSTIITGRTPWVEPLRDDSRATDLCRFRWGVRHQSYTKQFSREKMAPGAKVGGILRYSSHKATKAVIC